MEEVRPGDYVLVQDLKLRRSFVQASAKGRIKVAKQLIPAASLVGLRYGVLYEQEAGTIAPAAPCDLGAFTGEVTGDNRSLVDDNKAQALSAEEIKTMKDTFGGRKVIEELVSNSATFANKTQLSKEKYLRKKKAQHLCEFTLFRTSAFHIAETLFEQHKSVRPDILANIVTLANLNFAAKVLVVEDLKGIITGVCLQRCWEPVTYLVTGEKAKLPFLQYFNLTQEERARLKCVNLEELSGSFSSLVLVTSLHPKSALEALLPFLRPSAQIVIHSYTAQFLGECEQWLIRSGLCIDVRIEDFMTRKYQVLPARTHPVMSSGGHGGYLLSCIAVARRAEDKLQTPPQELEEPQAEAESEEEAKEDH